MRIKELVGEGRLDPIPIYIDSPWPLGPRKSFVAILNVTMKKRPKPLLRPVTFSLRAISILFRRRKRACA